MDDDTVCSLFVTILLANGYFSVLSVTFRFSIVSLKKCYLLGPDWVENATSVKRWKWSRPDVHSYTLLVKGLAASLRVSDALRMVDCVCQVGVSPGEEGSRSLMLSVWP
ncbi:Pentatricopeptide repeat superfamily protein [Perilla frutescens var. hirtella]|nr:Pentatricopeptide repeat superfamily protein [Perilla frutescens var. hirtella]